MKKKNERQLNRGEVIIYQPKSGDIELEVKLKDENIWLTQKQIAELFGVNIPAISKHVNNIDREGELTKKSTVSILETVQREGSRHIKRKLELFNLDMIIAVGYRINSRRATQFRIWATKILKKYLLEGYAVNEKRLLKAKNKFFELQQTINFLKKKSEAKLLRGQEKEILNLLADYSKTLTILEQYDKSKLKKIGGGKTTFKLTYEKCRDIIAEIKRELITKKEAGDIFGFERGKSLDAIIGNLYQTFGGKELYRDLESKASHLLYLIIKDHPFSDGNKRIGSFLFVHFLDKNNYLYRNSGERKINDNTLAALALLVAESNPKEKKQMVALITQLLR
ncbi:MAG: virulence protein RhuM/Fic/DOC family protein [Parcubacteria group bacterium]|jgi:prophage maintenance system killer protein/prophage antirepressor-like protein